jgi:putative redox protein
MSQVTAELTSGMKVSITNGRHTWQADEPVRAGGTDTGPNPYELLLSALATCTCVTIAMYCRHKGMTLHSVKASFEFSNIHSDDCEHCDDDRTGFIEHVASNVHISGDFDEKQQKRLAQVAARCPVHKTLANGVAFKDIATFD